MRYNPQFNARPPSYRSQPVAPPQSFRSNMIKLANGSARMMRTSASALPYGLQPAEKSQIQSQVIPSVERPPRSVDAGAALMNLFFDPIEAPFQLCCKVGSAAACCCNSEEGAGVDDPPCDCCNGVCSAFSGRWGISRIWKGATLFVAFFMYVFALVWIVAIQQGVQTCELGGMQGEALVAALMGLSTPTSAGKVPTAAFLTNFTQKTMCDPTACEFTMGGTTMNLDTYINLRLSVYLLSAAPIMYLLCMLVMHMQQTSNFLLTTLYPVVKSDTRNLDRDSVSDILWNATSAFQPQNWHLFWLSIMVIVNFIMGIFALAMDIGLAQSLGAHWDDQAPGTGALSPCRLVEQNMVHYQPGVRISIKDLPVALCIPCMLYTIWSVMFLANSAVNLCRRKLEAQDRFRPVEEPVPAAAPSAPPVVVNGLTQPIQPVLGAGKA